MKTGCYAIWEQVHNIEREINKLRTLGITQQMPVYRELYHLRARWVNMLGLKTPKVTQLVATVLGLSPGEFRVWFDIETGWMVEARREKGADPVYHSVDAETAVKVSNRELTPELEKWLLTPSEYIGE
jgi:hypothetical protein